MVAKEVKYESRETGPERKQRLRKEMISFYLNDVLATASAFVVLFALRLYSFWTLFRGNPGQDERHLALTILSCSGTAVVAFTFGKARK